jgi:hypothetical protein
MKKFILTLLLAAGLTAAFSQSNSFQALQRNFSGKDDVHSFRLSGFLCRTALRMVAPEEKLFRSMVKDIQQVRLMVIPKAAFDAQQLSVNGFRHFLETDAFESLATIRDNGDHISIFHRLDDNKKNRYFVLVEEKDEIVAIEMKGYIEPDILVNTDLRTSLRR